MAFPKEERDAEVAQARRYMAMPLTKAALDKARGYWVPWLLDALDDAEAARDLMEKKVITCGVAATHPDPLLTVTLPCYAETWNSPQADAVRALRKERDEARSLLLNGIQTNGDSLAFLEHVRREHAAVVAERDALKGQVREWISANGPGGWVDDLRKESGTLKAKLAALESSLAEMAVKLDEGIECYPSSPCNIFATLLELHGLWRGKPAAKEPPCAT